MPFRSRQQMKACFATHGFHGAIDCHEWAHATDMKSLKKQGGNMKYRGWKKGGCKMQVGGGMPDQNDYPDYESYAAALDAWSAQQGNTPQDNTQQNPAPQNSIDGFAGQMLLPDNMVNASDNGQWNPTMLPSPPPRPSVSYKPPTTAQKNISQSLQNLGIGMQRGLNGLSLLSGAAERNRQNQQDYRNQTALGFLNPMQISDYQPTPYNLYAQNGGTMKNPFSQYAKYGGNLKHIVRDHKKKYSNKAKMDFNDDGDSDSENQGMMQKGGGLSRASDYGSKGHPYPSVSSGDFAGPHRSYPIPTKADAIDALRLAHLHGAQDVIAKVHEKYPELQKGGNWIPKNLHRGRCTPIGNPNCRPGTPQYNLAMTFKKHHGFHRNKNK